MRVLFVIREDAERNLGGDTIQMLKTKAALEALGVTVHVRSPERLDALPTFDLAHVFNIQFAESSWRAFQLLAKSRRPILLSPIYWELFDLWFESAVARRPHWAWLARWLGNARTRRLYTEWHRRRAPMTGMWRTQRRLLQNAARILPNSRSEAELLRTTYWLSASAFNDKLDIVPNGIDEALYRSLPEPSRSFAARYGVRDFVLEVGRISPTKNQLGLIEALFDLPVPLVFIGHTEEALTEYAAWCRALAAQRGNTIFIDRLPHQELPRIYALAAVHALPSWRETPGLASLEAAAAGCRVVTTSIGSTRDYFGDLAWYCCPHDRASIRAAVTAAWQAPASGQLRERVLAHYTWAHAGQATLSSYQRALNEPQSRMARHDGVMA